ncbi:ATP-binding cassette domain-containing protein [bacterium]|nr:ATP-binding cassette domain-containing protein [bacterium]
MDKAIEIRDLTYIANGKKIIDGLWLEIYRGEIMGIVGPSGEGKTTLLRLILRLIEPTKGEILINGEDILKMDDRKLNEVRKKIGMVFQYSALFDSMKIWENVAFPLLRHLKIKEDEARRIAEEKLKAVGLEGVEDLYPHQLSGGMQKRVALARALALEPQIVLYDEPTAGLDPPTAFAIERLIVDTRNRFGVTSIVVSHDIESLFAICDRVGVLRGGKIIKVATPQELRESDDEWIRGFLRIR